MFIHLISVSVLWRSAKTDVCATHRVCVCVPEGLFNEASDQGKVGDVVGGGGLLLPQEPQHLLIDLLLHLLVQSQHVDRPGQGERCLERETERETETETEREGERKRNFSNTQSYIEHRISIWQQQVQPWQQTAEEGFAKYCTNATWPESITMYSLGFNCS